MLGGILYFVAPIAAFLVGLHGNRKISVGALVFCLLATGALSLWALNTVAGSGLHGWQYYTDDNSWPASLGMGLFLAALVLVGFVLFRNPKYATWFSAAIAVAYVVTSVPQMVVGCVLFAACP